MTSAGPVIELHDVSFAYGGHPILEEVSLAVAAREFVAVIGPNGGGKTTLLKLFLGLLEPAHGTVRVLGLSPAAARPKIGYMPQHVRLDPQFPASVLDIVLLGCLGGGMRLGPFRRRDKAAALEALAAVELDGEARRPFAALSGGQQQRTLIARALVGRPELLLLDEPTVNLDAFVEAEFFQLLKRLNERMTILTVSHDLAFVASFVDEVVCVNRRVVRHPTSELVGQTPSRIYGAPMRLVQHAVSHLGEACGIGPPPDGPTATVLPPDAPAPPTPPEGSR